MVVVSPDAAHDSEETIKVEHLSNWLGMTNGALWIGRIFVAALISQAFINHPGLEAWILLGASLVIGLGIAYVIRKLQFDRTKIYNDMFDWMDPDQRATFNKNQGAERKIIEVDNEADNDSTAPRRPAWVRIALVVIGYAFDAGVIFQLGYALQSAIHPGNASHLLDPVNGGILVVALIISGFIALWRWRHIGRELKSDNVLLEMISALGGDEIQQIQQKNYSNKPIRIFFVAMVSGLLSYGSVQIMLPTTGILGSPHWLSLVTGLVIATLLGALYAQPAEKHSMKTKLMTAFYTMLTIYSTLFLAQACFNNFGHQTWAQFATHSGQLTALVAGSLVAGILFGIAYWKAAKLEEHIETRFDRIKEIKNPKLQTSEITTARLRVAPAPAPGRVSHHQGSQAGHPQTPTEVKKF